jgi:hypothetical protein
VVVSIPVTEVTPLSMWRNWGSDIVLSPKMERKFKIAGTWIWSVETASKIHLLMTLEEERPIRYSSIAGMLCLSRARSVMNCYRVDYVRTKPSIRGSGIVTRLYRRLAEDGMVVMSGSSQSKHSQRLWKRLCMSKNSSVYVMDSAGSIRKARIRGDVVTDGKIGVHDGSEKSVMLLSKRRPKRAK